MNPSATYFAARAGTIIRHHAEQQVLADIRRDRRIGQRIADFHRVRALVVVRAPPAISTTTFCVTVSIAVAVAAAEDFTLHQTTADSDISDNRQCIGLYAQHRYRCIAACATAVAKLTVVIVAPANNR